MKAFIRLIGFSSAEAIMAVAIFLSMIAFVFWSVATNVSPLEQYFDSLHGKYTLEESYTRVSDDINSNERVANGVVFAVWAVVGLLAYYIVYFIFTSERNVSDFIKTLSWVHADKTVLLEYSIARMAIRVAALVGLLMTSTYLLTGALPYILGNLHVTSSSELFSDRALHLGVTCLILVAFMHIYVVLFRCLLLRQRLFSQN